MSAPTSTTTSSAVTRASPGSLRPSVRRIISPPESSLAIPHADVHHEGVVVGPPGHAADVDLLRLPPHADPDPRDLGAVRRGRSECGAGGVVVREQEPARLGRRARIGPIRPGERLERAARWRAAGEAFEPAEVPAAVRRLVQLVM